MLVLHFSFNGYESKILSFYHHNEYSLFFIIGKDGSLNGYMDKNLKIAMNAENLGFNVFIVENPGISRDDPERYFDLAFQKIKQELHTLGVNNSKFYAMGFSAGGHYVGRFAYKYPEIEKILLINPVLRVNFPKLLKALNQFQGMGTLIIGEKDSDVFWAPLLKQITSNITYKIFPHADHQFTYEGGVEDYINLPHTYLFNTI